MNQTLPASEFEGPPELAFDPSAELAAFAPARATFDFRYIVAAIRANIWLIAAIMAGSLALALISTLLQTPRFTARSSIQINDASARVLGSKQDGDAEADNQVFDIDRFLKTQVDILESRGMALRVAQKLKLVGNPRPFIAQGLAAPKAAVNEVVARNYAIGLLRGHLVVTLPRDSRIVTIAYDSIDPKFAALIANTYASEFIQANLQRKFESSDYARGFLSDQLTGSKVKLEASERALNAYARGAGLIRVREADGSDAKGGGNGGSVASTSLFQLNTAANDATARRIAAEGRWRSVSSQPLLSASEVVSNPAMTSLISQRAALEAALSEERSRHLDDFPTVKSKLAELATVNSQIQQAATNIRNAIHGDYLAALATEQQLKAQVEGLKGETLAEQDRNVQYGLLAREAETNRQVYDGLLERFKTLNAVAGVSLSNINIIDSADPPLAPSSPNLSKNLLLGLLLGAALAALTVFFKDQFDDSIRVPEDIEAKLGLPMLGVVPKSHDDEPNADLRDPKSPISEAYNSLRSSLLYSTAHGLPRVMLVTSAQPSEGKSTSSLAVATGFARMGKRVLLIDADLRRPSLHRRLAIENQHGLSDLLISHDPITAMVIPSGRDNLSVLLAGPIPPSPTELLSNVRIEEILHEAAEAFDVVVIDSPPILGLADAPLMAAVVDGVIFVVEADRSRRGSLKTSLRRLRSMRTVILGAVLTKFDPLKAGNRYSEYYGYQYYQYENRDAKKAG